MSGTFFNVCELVRKGLVRVSQHGLQELTDDEIDLQQVIDTIEESVVVEDYPNYHKGPCVLCLQRDSLGRPLHVLWGIAERSADVATIITAYRPDPARWDSDFKVRKPK